MPAHVTFSIPLTKEISGERTPRTEKSSWEKRSFHHPLTEQESLTPPLPPPTKKEKLHSVKKEIPIVNESETEGLDQTKDYEHDNTNPVGYDRTPKIIDTTERVRKDIESYSKTCKINPEKKNLLEALVEEVHKKNEEDKSDSESMKSEERYSAKSQDSEKRGSAGSMKSRSSSSSRKSKPLEAEFISAQFAKELAQNNLRHRPLPDVIEDKLFNSLQMQRVKNPGAALDTEPTAAAVAQKMYASPGPTQCSKLKIFRPKTAVPRKKRSIDEQRPKTCKLKDLQEIDLAICWDLVPPKPEDEPKRPAHIDGSNGSVAPGIFTIVKSRDQEHLNKKDASNDNGPKPKTAWPEINEKSKPVNASAVMDIVTNDHDEITKSPTQHNPHSNGKKQLAPINSEDKLSLNGSEENKNPNIPSPPNSGKNSSKNGSLKYGSHNATDSSISSEKLARQKHYRSSPNLSGNANKSCKDKMHFSRPCMACETKTPLGISTRQPRSEYKMAFKAGNPNSRSSSHNGSQTSQTTKPIAVPKPKTPFARKSYSINTLAPPFSLWPGTMGMDYPEHWRLASIYQQSYKPIESRKNPMIKGIYR
ncbi:unnamed protein product [Nezara viridula]|uniref:DUF4812 domain-containing protein n=1 Tax=Nezara viridula TaxID=85310 RepID=A0A9P0GZS3_NEZVI|nr:unnamed protein product [Nezara viridula]